MCDRKELRPAVKKNCSLCVMAFQELEWHKMDDVDFYGNIEDVPELVVKSSSLGQQRSSLD